MSKNLERKIVSEFVKGDSIRLVTTHVCQERCNFCHDEGTDDYPNKHIDFEQTISFLEKLRDQTKLNVIHLTGGEPSLYPDLIPLIRQLKNSSFKVQMTTNGDWKESFLNDLLNADLDAINFSLHAVTPDDFWSMQGMGKKGRNLEWCAEMMQRKMVNIFNAKKEIKTKLNTVVLTHSVTGRVIDFALNSNIPIRLMRNLNNVDFSEKIIQDLLTSRNLVPILEQFAVGDSGGSGTLYGYQDQSLPQPNVKVKRFGEVYLDSLCSTCSYKGTEQCREKFYGIRLEANPSSNEMQVKLCLDRQDNQAVLPVHAFFASEHLQNIKKNYE